MTDSTTIATWPQVLTDNGGWLRAVIYARVRDQDAVDEVLQETALAAASGKRPDDQAGLSRWLYRVAIRQAILYRRKRGRTEKKIEAYSQLVSRRSSVDVGMEEPISILAKTEQAGLVQQAMRSLGAADCEVLMLKYTENWSCRQMAERLGVSQSAIKSRLLRARANLRRELLKTGESWKTE